MQILELQIIFLSSLWLGTFVFSLIPVLCLRRSSHSSLSRGAQRSLSYLSCVAAGVLIGMCFLGLLPLVKSQFDKILTEIDFKTQFPVAECVVVLGFFLVLSIEQICTKCFARNRKFITSNEFEMRGADDSESIRKLLDEDFDADQDTLYDLNSQHKNNPVTGLKKKFSPLKNGAMLPKKKTKTTCAEGPSHCRHFSALHREKIGLRFFVLVLALSIHAVFEGLALGLIKETSRALRMFIAMILHESMCAFVLGVNLARNRLTLCAILVYIVFFSLTVPAGIGLGLVLGELQGVEAVVVAAVLQAMAAGIFVHVTFMEIIPGEFSDGKSGLLKVLFLFIGFLIIAAINIGQEVEHW
uniref:Zinc transporter ZIP3 n=1 Tax=Strigamia maritima TaxID=126957 RepID=T1J422_STRMM